MVSRRKKTTVYVDEELLRSARSLAARTDREEYEVFEEALRRYLEFADAAEGSQPRRSGLREHLLAQGARRRLGERPLPGLPDGEAPKLPDGATLSEAVLAEREERDY